MNEKEAPISGLTRTTSARSRWRRRTLVVLHLVSSGSWFGADVVFAVLTIRLVAAPHGIDAGVELRAIDLVVVPTVAVAGGATLVTGVVLATGTGRDLLRRWWVLAKLGITVLMLALVPIGLVPSIAAVRPETDELLRGSTRAVDLGTLVYPPFVAPVLLVVAFVLAVVRPWGRITRPGPDGPARRSGTRS